MNAQQRDKLWASLRTPAWNLGSFFILSDKRDCVRYLRIRILGAKKLNSLA